MARKKPVVIGVGSVGSAICDGLIRLGTSLYVVDIKHVATGNEWLRVGEDLRVAMEDCTRELDLPHPVTPVPADQDELVEA